MQKSKHPLYIFTRLEKDAAWRAKKTSKQIVEELKSRGINAEVSIRVE